MPFKTYVNASAGSSGGMAPITSPGGGSAPGGWHPTVLYMIGLVVAEIALVAWISKHL
jgi:hypothetical protein